MNTRTYPSNREGPKSIIVWWRITIRWLPLEFSTQFFLRFYKGACAHTITVVGVLKRAVSVAHDDDRSVLTVEHAVAEICLLTRRTVGVAGDDCWTILAVQLAIAVVFLDQDTADTDANGWPIGRIERATLVCKPLLQVFAGSGLCLCQNVLADRINS